MDDDVDVYIAILDTHIGKKKFENNNPLLDFIFKKCTHKHETTENMFLLQQFNQKRWLL